MRRVSKAIFVAVIALFIASCGGGIKGDRVSSGEAVEGELVQGEKSLKADLSQSNVEWIGSKPTGTHNGVIMLKEGTVELSDGEIVGGKFIIDMNTIEVIDLTDEAQNTGLRGHLMSADFFAVDSFPISNFTITGVGQVPENANQRLITGNLEIKGISRSISFKANISIEDNVLKASTDQFVINRAEWNIRYGSKSFFNNLKDNFIYDEIGLKINLTAAL